MSVGVKLMIVGASLVGVSCGGYVVYKNVSSSNLETETSKENVPDSPDNKPKEESDPTSASSSEASSPKAKDTEGAGTAK